MLSVSAAEEWQIGPQINPIGGRLTIDVTKPRADMRQPDELLQGLDATVRKVLAAQGVKTDTELAFTWEPEELETDLIQAGVEAEKATQAVDAWRHARDHAIGCMQAIGQVGPSAQPPAASIARGPPPQPPAAKIRKVNLHGTPSTSRPSSSSSIAALPASSGIVEAEGNEGDDKVHEISEKSLTEISCIIRAAGSDGPDSIELLRRMLEGADESRIKRSIRCWHRLAAFAGVGPQSVTVTTLCNFLLEVSKGRPTAAAGIWHQLDWWRAKFGIALPTRQPYAVAFRFSRPGRSKKQPPELKPGALLMLIRASSTGKGITREFALLVLLITVGCVRFKHQARSKLVGMDEVYLTFLCSLGKTRTGGARRPFRWLVPRCLMPEEDTFGPLANLLQIDTAACDRTRWIVPDIILRKDGRTGVFDNEATWRRDRPMPYTKFVDLLQGLLLSMGMERSETLRVTFNTLRRCLPSIGESVAYSTADMQSLSNWTEVPKGAATEVTAHATHPTSRVYAGGKDVSAGINRHKAVILTHMAAAALSLKVGEARCSSIDWPDMRQLRGQVLRAEMLAVGGPPWSLKAVAVDGGTSTFDLSKIDAMEEKAGKTSSDEGSNEAADEKTEQASSDEDSRSAASAEESAEQEEDGGGSDIADADAPLPFRTRGDGPIHLQNFLSPAGAVPYCRNAPYTGYVQEDKGAWDELCLNCKRRLPKGIFRKLRRSGGVG